MNKPRWNTMYQMLRLGDINENWFLDQQQSFFWLPFYLGSVVAYKQSGVVRVW